MISQYFIGGMPELASPVQQAQTIIGIRFLNPDGSLEQVIQFNEWA
jgi:hypothetical protein